MASLQRHSSGRSPYWFCKFRDANGRVCVKSTKQTKTKEARKVCYAFEDAAIGARAGLLTESQARKVISDLYEIAAGQPLNHATARQFLSDWAKSTWSTNAEGTAKRYRRTIEAFLEFLGPRAAIDVSHVTPKDVEGFRDQEFSEGKSSTTVNMAIKTLRIPFNIGRQRGMIPMNPAESVNLLPSDGEERECFTREQIQDVLRICDVEWRGLVLLGYYTGARLSVCARVKWGDADWENGVLLVIPNKIRRGKKPKPIPCPLHPELKTYLDGLSGPRHPERFVLTNLSQKTAAGKTGLSETFQDLLTQAGIEVPRGREKEGKGRQFRKLGFHSLRHTFNSDLANAGVPQEIRKRLTGHASDEMNEKYTHMKLAPLSAAIDKLSWIGG